MTAPPSCARKEHHELETRWGCLVSDAGPNQGQRVPTESQEKVELEQVDEPPGLRYSVHHSDLVRLAVLAAHQRSLESVPCFQKPAKHHDAVTPSSPQQKSPPFAEGFFISNVSNYSKSSSKTMGLGSKLFA